jgi:carbon starvation protein CstA
VQKLSDKIWITRKTRIYTEQRLLSNAFWTQFIMIFYSSLLLVLSIWILVNPSQKVEIFSIFSSVVVLVASIFLSSQQFKERSLAIKNSYIKLEELISRARRAEDSNDVSATISIESEYATILLNVENHTDYDFLAMRYSLRHSETTLPKLSWGECLTIFAKKVYRFFSLAFLLLLPLIFFILIKYVEK